MYMMKQTLLTLFIISILVLPLISHAIETNDTGSAPTPKLDNPLGSGTTDLYQFIKKLMGIVVQVAIPVAAIFIVYAGFLYVTARGDTEKIKTAHTTFLWTVIGTGVVLGAWVIITAIQATIHQLGTL